MKKRRDEQVVEIEEAGIEGVVAALTAIQSKGTFATARTCSSKDLRIELAGAGAIEWPVSDTVVQRLKALARPAPYGKRDKTLLDRKVRDTWEIEPRMLKINTRKWHRALDVQLAQLRDDLGLPSSGQLVAELDKVLLYEPGQFFAPHQDSERDDDMVGTLVVTLPSACTGGEVVVEHRGEKKAFRTARLDSDNLSLLAFYADCHHEVKPLKSGARVVLTYRLRYREIATADARVEVPPAHAERLTKSVASYFATLVPAYYGQSEPQRPDRLIYLLDHEYTQKSLAWNHLKNADRLRAAGLREAANRLDCEVFLALADVHETWQCEDEEWGGRGRYGYRRYEDDEELDDDSDDHELIDLIESQTELRHWIAGEGAGQPTIPVSVKDDEVCFTTPTVEMDPFKSEHEGYMGNYGNTVDRWYHRAAVVLWPRERDFVIRAKLSPAWAVDQIRELIKARSLSEARAKAASLRPFWASVVRAESRKSFFANVLKVLSSLADSDLSRALLAPFGPEHLAAGNVSAFAALIDTHGAVWAKDLFTAWREMRRRDAPWRPFLPRFFEALLAKAPTHGRAFAEWLLDREASAFGKDLSSQVESAAKWDREVTVSLEDLAGLLESAAVIGVASAQGDLISLVTAPKTALPLQTLGALLRQCRQGRADDRVRSMKLGRLASHVEAGLAKALKKPPRTKDDWSIEPPMRCACELCCGLAEFLRDPARTEHRWPLAKDRRQHVHEILDRYHLPVSHVTERRGSPYTLVLKKLETLFKDAAALRAEQEALAAWISSERQVLVGDKRR